MLQPTYPGVYTQEQSTGTHSVAGTPTSVALFVGPTLTGIDNRPIRLLSYADFERSFGGLSQASNLSYSVLHFFANGGGSAYVIRVPSDGAQAAATAIKRDGANTASVTATALSSGQASNNIYIEFDNFGIGANPYTATPDKKRFNLTITDVTTGQSERFTNISTSSASARFAKSVVGDPDTGSSLIALDVNGMDADGPQASGTIYSLAALPAAGAAPDDIKVSATVSVRNAAGAVDNTLSGSVSLTDILVIAKAAAMPASKLEAVNKLVAALNQAFRAMPTPLGVDLEGALFEGGAFLRLRTAPPTSTTLAKRLNDATVTITDPGTGTSFLATFLSAAAPVVSNPSRYQLGAPYTGAGVQVAAIAATSTAPAIPTPGADGTTGQPSDQAFLDAVTGLGTPDPFFNILCLPDLVRPASNDPTALAHSNAMTVYAEAALVCAQKFALLLMDPSPDVASVGAAESWKSTKITFQSDHAAAFFPNIRVDDPLASGTIRSHPPSGAVAGIIARTDAKVGVWQAPAGVDASLSGVYGPSIVMSDAEHGILNPIAVNCIRQFPIYGTVVFGARTVDGSDAQSSDWKYIPVRRTSAYILRSLAEGLRWAVLKPNGEQLWSQIRLSVTGFMQGLFRQGAFKGASARDAYFVLCDASTTTQADIDAGVVNIVIGFAPLKPAEFVVITLRQIVQPLT